MFSLRTKSNCNGRTQAALVMVLVLGLASPVSVYGGKKKTADAPPQPAPAPNAAIDTSKLVWPNPPNIARVRYLN
jgi:hypothetical protein